jgi:RHS repeat-associated protein
MEPLRKLLHELDRFLLMGQYAQQLNGPREGLWSMDNRPEISFRCGPLALDRIRAWGHSTNACHPLIFNSKSTTNGICLLDVAKLSRDLGMNYQIAFRSPGAPLIVPSVIHWKVGHYAALVRQARDLFQAQDPTFWNDTWISPATLDEEASGYFLIPPGPLLRGWRAVGTQEAANIWGKGTTLQSDPDATTPWDPTLNDDQCSAGMPRWDFNLMLINQRITDTPIGYRPPVGPPVFFTVTMNAQDNWARAFPSWWGTTLGMDWSCNWNSFVQEDPFNPSGNLRVYFAGGWLTFMEDPATPGLFKCQFLNPGYIQAVATNGTTFGYRWIMLDGSSRSYSQYYSPSGGSLRFALLTAVLDASGNGVALEYDNNFPGRIHAIVDALGQRTTLEYGLTDPGAPPPNPISQGNVQFNWQVTRITDPFGRSATFQYQLVKDLSPPGFVYYLTNITDVAGMSSQLEFDAGFGLSSFPVMPKLTTAYGTTLFRSFVLGNRNFGFEITDPNGDIERLQYSESSTVNIPATEPLQEVPQGMLAQNDWLYARNVYFWSKKAYAQGFSPTDYSQAVIYHFTHAQDLSASGRIIESVKRPKENRIWFNYPGQGIGWFPGTDNQPSKIGRVLDDGTTQLWQFDRNELGHPTNVVDPVGRTFSFIYATNAVDLLEVRQTRNGQKQLLASAAYNTQHLPLTVTDAAGQTTVYTYNPRGQPLSITNPKNETTTFGYDTNGYLLYIDGPLPGTQDRDSFTYDGAGRIHTATDRDGYSITLDYDDLDRLTKVTYPDSTYQEIVYDRLKPGSVRDRLGRVTAYSYTALGQLASIQDPLGRLTRFQWCRCGELEALIDPVGRMTSWQRDIEGRVTSRTYADGSTINYQYERTSSRLHSILDQQNQVVEFDYYPDDALKARRYPNASVSTPTVQFTYDPDIPRLATMQDGQGTTTYTYNPVAASAALGAGLVAAIDGPLSNDTITFSYDELGRVAEQAINGVSLRRSFDAGGRLIQLTNVLGTFGLTWEGGSGRLSTIQYPNGQHTQYSYFSNAGNQLLQRLTHYLPNNSILSEFTYGYNAVGQITNWTQLQAGVLQTWLPAYDDADRLLSVTVAQGGSTAQAFNYTYDDADNRTLERSNSLSRNFFYNALNEMAVISNSAADGSAYEWDAANQLVAISNGTHRAEFSYDGFGRRVRIVEKDNGTVTDARRYVWCGLQLCEERSDSGADVLKRYSTFGVSSESPNELPMGHYFFTRDHLSSVREMSDASSAVRAQFSYSPYGLRQRLGGDLEAGFGFTGHFLHQPSSLLLAPYRAYDANLGRWLSRDPAGEAEGANVYAYAGNDPVDFFDATGLAPAAAALVANTPGYQQAQQGVDAYDKGKEVLKTLDDLADKGLKQTAEDKLRDEGKDAMKKIAPNPIEDYKRPLQEAEKTGKNVGAFGKLVRADVVLESANQLAGGDCAPKTSKTTTTQETKTAEEPGPLDTLIDAVKSLFSSAPEPPAPSKPSNPSPTTPIPRTPDFSPAERAAAAR